MPHYFKFPDVGEGLTEAELLKWERKEGDYVKEDEIIAEVETAKAIVQIHSPASGYILKLNAKEGDTVFFGQVIAVIGEKGEKFEYVDERLEKRALPERKIEPKPEVFATPKVKRLAQELHVELAKVSGTGPDGRITEEDVGDYAKSAEKTPYEKYGPVERLKLHGIRKEIAESIKKSYHLIPHVTMMFEADVTELVALRNKIKEAYKEKGLNITYLPFITKAVIEGLKRYPVFNSSFDGESNEIVLKKYYHIGIAIDTENGVMVPIVKNADKKTILDLAKEMAELAEKARNRELMPDNFLGGSFTITNVGAVGGIQSTPIIHYPEAAVLAMHTIKKMPIVRNGKMEIRDILPLALSFDHRIADGGIAARFMGEIISHLEDPKRLTGGLI